MNFKFQISNFKYKNQRGFTLIELLVVIVIIGILATFLMTNFSGVRARARDAQRKSDIKQIQAALEMYRADNGGYPTAGAGAGNFPATCGGAFSNAAGTTVYMPKVPCDPSSGGLTPYNATFTNAIPLTSYNKNYCLRACLENSNDNQATVSDHSCGDCTAPTVNYTVVNP